MTLPTSEFLVTDWETIPSVKTLGEQGFALTRSVRMGELTIKLVHYSPGYVADHWCDQGHILFVFTGELHTQLQNGRRFVLPAGTSYRVSNHGDAAHRSSAPNGAELFMVD